MREADSLHSELLSSAGFRHAFFTRLGGVSEGPYRSLNFSISVGDEPLRVQENLHRAAASLRIRLDAIYFASQVHGNDAIVAEPGMDREAFLTREADAVVSIHPELACSIRTADCVPILVADRTSGAVAAIHAGWRGVVRRVVPQGVERLREVAGIRGDLIAAIGPHISVRAFEVSEDVARQLATASEDQRAVDASRAKPHVDLRRIVRAQLRSLGLADEAIEDVPGCTLSEPERFFSFRRDGARSGRHLSAIVPASTGRAPRAKVA